MMENSNARQWNQLLILREIDRAGETTAGEIAEATGLSAATVSRILSVLKENKLVSQHKKSAGELGRRPVSFRIHGGYAYSLHFALEGAMLRGYLLDLRGKVVARDAVAASDKMDATDFLDKMLALVCRLEEKKRSAGPILTVRVAIPGIVDSEGVIRRIPSFPMLESAPLEQMVREAVGKPCAIYNTSRLSALGAYFRREIPVKSLVYVDINQDGGIGAGIVLDGKLYEDSRGMAGELGDMVIHTAPAFQHTGESQGTLEQEAGLKTLLSRAQQLLDKGMAPELCRLLDKQPTRELTLSLLEKAAMEQDLGIQELLSQVTRTWAAAIVNVCALICPDLVVLGGALHRGHKFTEKMVRHHLSQLYYRPIALEFAEKATDAHVMGAAHLCRGYLFETVMEQMQQVQES